MTVTTTQPHGTFCWPELCSGAAADSKEFYSSLLGWKSSDRHMPEGDYRIFKLGNESVGAMYQMKEERKKAGVLPHWNSYIAVSNADETVKKAASLGGKALMQPFDADGNRMANLQDPTGANFSIWQATKPSELTRINDVGALCWTELYTHDPEKAAVFNSALYRWRPKRWHGGPMPYTMFNIAGREQATGGMLATEMPGTPHWLPYFQVRDADKATARVQELGGKITNEVMDIPSIGRMVMVADSQGAKFAMIKPDRDA